MQGQDQKENVKNQFQLTDEEQQAVIDISVESSIDRDIQLLALKEENSALEKELATLKTELTTKEVVHEQESAQLRSQIDQERNQLQERIDEEAEQRRETDGELQKLQVKYEGLLAREERYRQDIRQLKDQVQQQKNALYKTYSYRLGYLLIHSTQSFRNFVRLPKELIGLYRDNKQRKDKSKQKVSFKTSYSPSDNHSPIFHKALDVHKIEAGRDKVRIATIMDEFTTLCFASEAETLALSPSGYKVEISGFKPDFVFIESAWQGKDSLWKLKISQQGQELIELIQYCRDNNIRTLFWNKEDPVHFGTFIETAKLVDVVFTTDIDCIKKYKEILQHDAVYLLPFAAQPKTHNPIELFERQDKFNFAGSYYLKYPVRQRDFATLSEVAIQTKGLDIYDRNFNKDHPHYQFPEQYQSLILGALRPEEIDRAYKGYEFGINMNTIKQSQTMFARRVFEMLASNTIVLSNYSRGVRLFFGDLVICSDNANELQRQLDNVLVSELSRKKFKLQGLRNVLSEHTYTQRLEYILQKLKIEREEMSSLDQIAVLAQCEDEQAIERVIAQFNAQTLSNKSLFIISPIERECPEGITFFNRVEDLLNELQPVSKTCGYSHFAIFGTNDYYGPHYLEDLLLSYCYLQYHNNPVVTKCAYYRYDGQGLALQKGIEYQFVSEAYTTRSLYPTKDFSVLLMGDSLEALLTGKMTSQTAFAVDALSYLEQGLNADVALCKMLGENQVVDGGVSLVNHLQPIAESVRFKRREEHTIKKVEIDMASIKETLRKEIKLGQGAKTISFNSKLPVSQHRLIKLSQVVSIKDWDRMLVECGLQSKGDVRFVVEFLGKDKEQISHVTLVPSNHFSVDIPKKTVYARFNLRIKGVASVQLSKSMTLQLNNNSVIENNTYDSDDLVLFTPEEIDAQLQRPQSKQITIQKQKGGLSIRSNLAPEKHAYIYFKKIFTRSEVNLVSNSIFETRGTIEGADFRTVFIFLDKNKEKIAHTILQVDNFSHAMAIPEKCEFVRIGFKITGSGSALVTSLKIGELKERINDLVGKSDTLVLAKQYPAYNDLYRYGFLHSRLRAYKKAGELVDVFKIAWGKGNYGFSEFESIDVFTGEEADLKNALLSGQFKRVFVHILDRKMWEVLEEFVDKLEIIVWVHGSEAQLWQRRAYELEGMPSHEVDRKKRLSEQRRSFWKNLLAKDYRNLKLIFVSEYFKNEFVEDICDGKENFNYEIIHNLIDSDMFPYHEKKAEDAYKVLSIRPFSSLTYANDITVKAILELSKSPEFERFQFTIVGDGDLFEETVAPLRNFKNVTLRKEFLTQAQIADLHREHGVFLVPTRMDTQGVSRGEAMSSGLVAVTTDVAAVSEFVSSDCGVLVSSEDYKALAEKLLWLAQHPEEFMSLSVNGRARVLEQCNQEQTISQELKLL